MNKYIVNHGEGAILRIEFEEPEDLIVLDSYLNYMRDKIRETQAETILDIELLGDMCSEYLNTDRVMKCILREWEEES